MRPESVRCQPVAATIKLTHYQNPSRPIAGPERVAGEDLAFGAVLVLVPADRRQLTGGLVSRSVKAFQGRVGYRTDKTQGWV
jgi:hypothetical protein